jgi:hypothetical protein
MEGTELGTLCDDLAIFPAELAEIIEAWERLSPPIRTAILGLIRANKGEAQ